MIFPAEKFAVAAASNLEGANPVVYAKRLAELVLDEDLDTAAYAPDRNKRMIYSACEKVFDYGLSEFERMGGASAGDDQASEEASRYFNACVDENALKGKYAETWKKTTAGIHPSAGQPFTRLGSYMASVLKESLGEEKFRSSRKNGPIAFFGDYMRVVKTRPGQKKFASFTRALERQVADWEKDWNRTYTEYVRRLAITPATNFDEVGGALKKIFSGAAFTRDFSEEFGAASRYYLERGNADKALSILSLDRELYPSSAFPYAALGATYLWTGNLEAARENYKKAVDLDPAHPQVSPGQIVSLINQLRAAKKMREALEASLVFIDLFPKDARLI